MRNEIKKRKKTKEENEQEDRNWNPSMKNWLPKTGYTERHQGGASTQVYVLMPRCQSCQRGKDGGAERVQESEEEERERDKMIGISYGGISDKGDYFRTGY